MAPAAAKQPLLSPRRTHSGSMFSEHQDSPLHDLSPIAQPGIASRVSRDFRVGTSLGSLRDTLLEPAEQLELETVITVDGGLTWRLAAAAAASLCSSLQYGFHLGNMNTASDAMRTAVGIAPPPASEGRARAVNDLVWGFCVAVVCLGALVGCSLGARVADSLGRRRAILTTTALFLCGTLVEVSAALARSRCADCGPGVGVLLLVLGRVLVSVACGATTVVTPIYLGEISPPELRGALGALRDIAPTPEPPPSPPERARATTAAIARGRHRIPALVRRRPAHRPDPRPAFHPRLRFHVAGVPRPSTGLRRRPAGDARLDCRKPMLARRVGSGPGRRGPGDPREAPRATAGVGRCAARA